MRFGDITRERLKLICTFLQFANNETLIFKNLFKIFPVILHMNNRSQELYLPHQDISFYESLTPWKGRLSFKQYLPLKASKFGVKNLWNVWGHHMVFMALPCIYTGNNTKLDSPLITADTNTTAAILKLVEPLLKQCRTVWMDNFCNSPSLTRMLKIIHKTDCSYFEIEPKGCSCKSEKHKTKKRRNRSTAFRAHFRHYDLHISQSWHQDC
jgi:hypothetical protein